MKANSRHRPAHILSTSSSKTGSMSLIFDDFDVKSSSRYGLVHLLSTSSSKVVGSPQFLTLWCNMGLSLQSCAPFTDLIFKKWLDVLNFATILIWNRAPVHLLSTSSSKKVLVSPQFLTISMWNQALAENRVRILPTSSSKVAGGPQFFNTFMWHGALATVLCTFCRPHLQKVLVSPQFLTISMWNQALAENRVRILPTSSSTVAGGPQFFNTFMWHGNPATVLCTFCRPHLQKVVVEYQFLTISMWNRALAQKRVHILPTSSSNLGRRSATFMPKLVPNNGSGLPSSFYPLQSTLQDPWGFK